MVAFWDCRTGEAQTCGLHLVEKSFFFFCKNPTSDHMELSWTGMKNKNSVLLFLLLRTPNQFTHQGRALWQDTQFILFWCFNDNIFSCCEASELFIVLGKHYAFLLYFDFAYQFLLSTMPVPSIRDTSVSA